MQNPPRDERYLQRRLAELERRIKALETEPRGAAGISLGSRSTDPPAPPADRIVLYVKTGRLYYEASDGTVYGPI